MNKEKEGKSENTLYILGGLGLLFALIVFIFWDRIICLSGYCPDKPDKIITSNKCTNLHKIEPGKQASVCIARDDTGLTSIGWFAKPGHLVSV